MNHIPYTWIRDNDLTKYQPISQAYGICFNEANEILILKKLDDPWSIPGGRPEHGETLEETLIREMEEEATVLVKNCQPLGVQKVTYPGNINANEGEEFYQARFVCAVDEVLDHTPDPDKEDGMQWERKWVSMNEIEKWVDWGEVGHQMFADAIDMRIKNSA